MYLDGFIYLNGIIMTFKLFTYKYIFYILPHQYKEIKSLF